MKSLIVTLTANPAIDLNFSTDKLAFDDRSYLLEKSKAPGGRGINASMVLQSFGVDTLAIAPVGGADGEKFEEFLGDYGLQFEAVRIREEIRTNYSITDRQGLTVKLDQKGPTLNAEEVAALERTVEARLGDASWLMLCGSLPPGAPRELYHGLIERARSQNVRTLLDADGEPLVRGLEARPTVVAPNQSEAERLMGRALITRIQFQETARRIQAMGAESVILSLGSRGAVVAYSGKVAEVLPPRVDAVCPIGAGDALNAAFIWAMEQTGDFLEAIRWGVAAGTASARLPGLGFATLEQTREVFPAVEVRSVS